MITSDDNKYIKCPFCKCLETVRILYDYPDSDEKRENQIDSGKVSPDGSALRATSEKVISIQKYPTRLCRRCKKQFGTPPLMVDEEEKRVVDYRDIVTYVQFSVGGFFSPGGGTMVTLEKDVEGGCIKQIIRPRFSIDQPKYITIDTAKWDHLLDTLFLRLYIHEWPDRYDNPHVMDGTQWSLILKSEKKELIHIFGSNAYPPYWMDLERAFQKFCPMEGTYIY